MSFADFLACMRQVVYDYEPAETPAQLMRQADAVVTGTIVEMKAGRSYASTPASRDLDGVFVLEVKVDRVLAGDRTVVADGFVSIEMPNPRGVDGCLEAPVPTASGVFFLVDVTSRGARITTPLVQGFLIENERGKLVSVMDSLETMSPSWRALDSVDEVLAELG